MTTSGLIQLIAIFQITSNSSVGPWKQFAIGIAMHRGIGSGTWISLRRALMEVTWFWQNVCRLGLIGRKRLCLLYIQYIQYIYIYAGHHMTNYSILMILMCLLKLFFLVYIYICVCVTWGYTTGNQCEQWLQDTPVGWWLIQRLHYPFYIGNYHGSSSSSSMNWISRSWSIQYSGMTNGYELCSDESESLENHQNYLAND